MSPGDVRHVQADLVLEPTDRLIRDRGLRTPPLPLDRITYRVVAEVVGGARQELDPPFELVVRRNPSGYDLYLGTAHDGRDYVVRPGLAGRYVVRAESRIYQAAERDDIDVPTPGSPYAFVLEPGYAYPFDSRADVGPTLLRGTVRRRDGSGMADVVVEVAGVSNRYRTDASGRWVLVFPDGQPTGDVTVRFAFPDGSVLDIQNVFLEAGRARALAETTFRGSVLADSGIALAGASVSVSGHPGRTTTGPDGGWVYVFPLDQPPDALDVTAVLPDGRSRTQPNQQVQPRSTVVVPTFRFQ